MGGFGVVFLGRHLRGVDCAEVDGFEDDEEGEEDGAPLEEHDGVDAAPSEAFFEGGGGDGGRLVGFGGGVAGCDGGREVVIDV